MLANLEALIVEAAQRRVALSVVEAKIIHLELCQIEVSAQCGKLRLGDSLMVNLIFAHATGLHVIVSRAVLIAENINLIFDREDVELRDSRPAVRFIWVDCNC